VRKEARAHPRILILGVGNILQKDEGVGVRVVQEMARSYSFPPGVELLDGATAGVALLSRIKEFDHLIVVDTVQAGAEPGAVFRFTPEEAGFSELPFRTSVHEMGLPEVLTLAEVIGRRPQTVIIGIQPEDMVSLSEDLSPLIQSKVPEVIELVLEELRKLGIEV